jgi:hypothetical protein
VILQSRERVNSFSTISCGRGLACRRSGPWIGGGVSFDVSAGTEQRAPKWMHALQTERL